MRSIARTEPGEDAHGPSLTPSGLSLVMSKTDSALFEGLAQNDLPLESSETRSSSVIFVTHQCSLDLTCSVLPLSRRVVGCGCKDS